MGTNDTNARPRRPDTTVIPARSSSAAEAPSPVVRFAILGGVRATVDGEALDLGWPKQRALLAALLLTPNRVVARADLTVALWGPNPPASSANAVQKYVCALRQILGSSRVLTRAPGYLIVVEPDELDLLEFEAHHTAGRWRDALAVWSGNPCEDVELLGSWGDQLQALRERRDDVHGKLVDERLAAGEHESLIPELRAMVRRHPLHEQHWARLIRALHGAGRTAQALATYAELRALLADELGIDPGSELQELHHALLTADEPDRSRREPASARAWEPQCQLPLDVTEFVGRGGIQESATALLTGGGMPILVLSGSPGCGKTALAVHIGHRVRPCFPDGQWFIRLDGASASPRNSSALLAELLYASGLDGPSIPEGVGARAAALRARLADRRVLLVLDDAASVNQVAPLLPGTEGCAVLVTSRNTLGGLTALHGARSEAVEALDEADATALLLRLIPPVKAAGASTAIGELANLCGRLPLALRIAAANIATHPTLEAAECVAQLAADDRLSRLAVAGERDIAVRAAFDASYRGLSSADRRAFRLLGLIPGPDFTAAAAAALLGVDVECAGRRLASLAGASLIAERTAGRFHLHDLLRLYAFELATAHRVPAARAGGTAGTGQESTDAVTRLYSWYLESCDSAGDALYGQLERLPRDRAGGEPMTVTEAWAWLDAELPNLVAAIHAAELNDQAPVAWHLADALRGCFWFRQLTSVWDEVVGVALAHAVDAGNERAEAAMRASLGDRNWAMDNHATAIDHYQHAVALIRRFDGDATAVLGNLCGVHHSRGDLLTALDVITDALAEADRRGNFARQLASQVNRGGYLVLLGRLREAAECLDEALRHCASEQNMYRSFCLNALAERDLLLDRPRDALRRAEEARALFVASGHERGVLMVSETLAKALGASGDVERALVVARETADECHRLQAHDEEVAALATTGRLHGRRGEWEQSRVWFERSLLLAQRMGRKLEVATARLGLATAEHELGRTDTAALDRIALAVAAFDEIGVQPRLADARHEQARFLLAVDRPGHAVQSATLAVDGYARTGQVARKAGATRLLQAARAAAARHRDARRHPAHGPRSHPQAPNG